MFARPSRITTRLPGNASVMYFAAPMPEMPAPTMTMSNSSVCGSVFIVGPFGDDDVSVVT